IRSEASYWDFVVVRRLVENLSVHYVPCKKPSEDAAKGGKEGQHASPAPSIKSRFRFKFHAFEEPPVVPDEPAWACVLLPKTPQRQLGGLLTFAEKLKWPNFETLRANLTRKINDARADPELMKAIFAPAVRASPLPPDVPPLDRSDIFAKSRTCQLLRLHHPGQSAMRERTYIGGWLSRSWFTGCVLPGESINHLLMCTILENDAQANEKLGPIANLYGGFVYSNASWWSRMCIVGRVLACMANAAECQGWMYAPLTPEAADGEMHRDAWFEVEAIDVLRSEVRRPRIFEPQAVLHDSSPLGWDGKLTASVFSLPLDDSRFNPELRSTGLMTVVLDRLVIDPLPGDSQKPGRPLKAQAAIRFVVTKSKSATATATTGDNKQVVTFPLSYAVCFISSFPCLTPNGFIAKTKKEAAFDTTDAREGGPAAHHQQSSQPPTDSTHSDGPQPQSSKRHRSRRLPGHFLHIASYPYEYIPIADLPTISSFPPREPTAEVGDILFSSNNPTASTNSSSSTTVDEESAIVDDDDDYDDAVAQGAEEDIHH
ncbi:hypothetical protein KEM56_001433, partial [Ascosphaera pollenicola]